MATIHQKRQRALVAAYRRYKALGFAYKLGPIVKPLLLEGLSQRQIADELTRRAIPTASEWNHESGRREQKGKNRWTQTQVARLLKNLGEVTKKMKWYYVHAHKELLTADVRELFFHPGTGELTSGRLIRHTRKTPGKYYQNAADAYRMAEMDKAGYSYSLGGPEPLGLQWKRFVNLRSYHRRKGRKAKAATSPPNPA